MSQGVHARPTKEKVLRSSTNGDVRRGCRRPLCKFVSPDLHCMPPKVCIVCHLPLPPHPPYLAPQSRGEGSQGATKGRGHVLCVCAPVRGALRVRVFVCIESACVRVCVYRVSRACTCRRFRREGDGWGRGGMITPPPQEQSPLFPPRSGPLPYAAGGAAYLRSAGPGHAHDTQPKPELGAARSARRGSRRRIPCLRSGRPENRGSAVAPFHGSPSAGYVYE